MAEQHLPDCPHCHIGVLKETRVTYSAVLDGLPLSVADMRAWRCDVCNYLEFDDKELRFVEALLGVAPTAPDPLRAASKPTTQPDANDTTQPPVTPRQRR